MGGVNHVTYLTQGIYLTSVTCLVYKSLALNIHVHAWTNMENGWRIKSVMKKWLKNRTRMMLLNVKWRIGGYEKSDKCSSKSNYDETGKDWYSDWVESSHDISKCLSCCLPKSLPPHKFIHVGRQLSSTAPSHPLELCFASIPIALYMLSMGSSCWINKFDGVVHSFMCWIIGKAGHSTISPPLVWVDNRSRNNVSLYQWQ